MRASDATLLRVEAASLDSIFATDPAPAFPHTGRGVRPDLASYLERRVRERPRDRSFVIEVTVGAAPTDPAAEERARRALGTYFGEEATDAQLDVRVNRREGWGFLRRGGPLALVALAIAGALYLYGPGLHSGAGASFATAVVYLFFITIVWVVLWDPIEKLTFDAFLLHARVRALRRLEVAQVRFRYVAPATRPPP